MSKQAGDAGRRDREGPVPLHEMPSASAEDPIVVYTPARRTRTRRSLKWCAAAVCIVALLAIAAVAALESGAADQYLTARARGALQDALGPGLSARLGGASVRVSSGGIVMLQARDVSISDEDRGATLASARSIDLDLAPVPLLSGKLSVSSLDIDGVTLDPAAFGSDKPLDVATLRVDSLDRLMDRVFAGADRFLGVLAGGRAKLIRITNTRIGETDDGKAPLTVEALTLSRAAKGTIRIDGTLLEGTKPAHVHASAIPDRSGREVDAIDLKVTGLDTRPFLIQHSADGTPAAGLATSATLTASARRRTKTAKPSLEAKVTLAPGRLFAGGEPAEIKGGTIALDYDFARRSIDIAPSVIDIGASSFPFTGGVIDLSNLPDAKGEGFALDLVTNDAVSAPLDSNEAKLPFSGKIFARYLKEKKQLNVSQLSISTPLGSLAGSLEVDGGGRSPEVSFVAKIATMKTAAIKQLWPYWLAFHAREWVLNNLSGGTISNGSIKVYIPKNEIADNNKIELGPDQLRIDFDYDDASIHVAGDIPPLRHSVGHLKLAGTRLDVALSKATAYFKTGRKVDVDNTVFSILDTEAHPLMGQLALSVTGKADAVAELVSYDPLNALQRTDYKAGDFSGDVSAKVHASFGLLQEQNPPKADWDVEAKLDDVDLAPKVDGHDFKDLDGTLKVDPDKAVLDTNAKVDGFPMKVDLTQPLDKDSPAKTKRVISARLGNDARKALLPGLNDILDGPVDMTMTRTGDGTQSVTADLTDAALTVPGLGWTKGAGVAAKAAFTTDDDGKALTIRDFSLSGSGFSASGTLQIAGGTLTSASFDDVRLSPTDRFSVKLARQSGGFHVDVDGASVDLRSLIGKIKGGASSSGGGDTTPITLDGKFDTAIGFNKENLNGVTVSYAGSGGNIQSLDFKGVTPSGEALVAKITPDGDGQDVTVTCGDGGDVARFTDIYSKIVGGLLSLHMRKNAKGPYRGTLKLSHFSVSNESRLKSIVNAQPNRSSRSLRETVNQPIDTKSPEFQHASARLVLGQNYLTVSDGVLRGTQIGSTFQGTVYDSKGNMRMTGTFMPAYGINRLFADVPIIGAILGNGRDRGLIGITFRLTGKVSSPKLEVNPLSAIAPGIFRQIFEY